MFLSCTRIGIPAERIIGSRWSIPANAIKVDGETTMISRSCEARKWTRDIHIIPIGSRDASRHDNGTSRVYFRVHWYLWRSTRDARFTVSWFIIKHYVKIIPIAILLTSRTKKKLKWLRKINMLFHKKFVYLFKVIMTHRKSWSEIRYQY